MTERELREAPPSDGAGEWEVFRQATTDDPPRHVGSVSAGTAAVAREQAETLFPDAAALWLCPADEVRRVTERDLAP